MKQSEEDVNMTKTLLKQCSHYYYNLQLSPDCEEKFCQQVPTQCTLHNAVYHILDYLVDIDFLPENVCKQFLFKKYLGLKITLFNEYLIEDTWLIGAGGMFILLSMWLYTSSLFVTLMTVIAIIFSLGISYFMYTLLFELNFFPFMNLLASIVAVGIGADDAFIFCKVWQCAKTEKDNGTLVKLVHDTLKHATLSMFVTTLTTAAAFYASYVSSITAIGTATLANFALMVTWLPASVVVYMWFVILGSLAVASTVVIFYHPRLKLPDTKNFQLFDSSHLFEQYDMVYKDISRGTLVYDSSFDMAAPESQKWLLKFCHRLRNQPFYQPVLGPLLPNCFMESFSSWMQRRCIDPIDNLNRTPCCETYNAPYKREVFQYCIVLAIADLYETPAEYFMPGVAGPKFCRESHPPRICALVVEYDSNHPFSMSYKDIGKFYRQVEMWTKKQMSKAPEGMQHGWFISDLEFYDLQHTLSQDTLVAIGVSMGISLVVLLLVTLNILISLYAILTITCVIFVTVAILVLLNWKLNVLESIAISVAIGLAVDFSLHYSVHYRICPEGNNREYAVSYAISRMGGPTAMAALTTAAAGAFMLPSSILAYMQIGIFLVVVMAVSWIYSTFFLGALLCIGGPQHGFGQFSYPSLNKCCSGNMVGGPVIDSHGIDHVDKTVYTNVLSESTLSTSSTVCQIHPSASESHELEALTTRQYSNFNKRLKRSGSFCIAQTCNNQMTRKVSLPADQSPSATSATTVVLIDDLDVELRHGIHDITYVPLMRH
nr:unnamed protein product [Timema californicum]